MILRLERRALCGLLIPTLWLLSGFPAAAKGPTNDPAALIAKMEVLYRNAKSFQGKITMRRSGKTRDGKAFSMSETRDVRYKAPNRVFDDQRYTGTGPAARVTQQSALYVGDGKTLTVYKPSVNQYAQRPASPTLSLTQIVGRYLINTPNFTLSMGSPTKVNGRDALVVLAKPKVPKEFPPNVKKEDQPKLIEEIKKQRPTQVFIDKANYQLLRVAGGSPTVSDEVNFVSQAINGAVADSAFAFHAPAGAKRYAPPPGAGNPQQPNAVK